MRIGQVQYPLILWWATIVHVGLGTAILIDNRASAVLLLVGLQNVAIHLGATEIGIILILFSFMAAFGLFMEHKLSRALIIALLFPQYVLLIACFLSDIWIFVDGYENSSGNQIPRAIIFAALWPVMAGAILHTVGIVERYFWKWTTHSQSQL